MNTSTSNPVVLVTGAAKRLGREIALALAKSGWQVAVHYNTSKDDAIKTAADCEALAGFSGYFSADLSIEAAVKALPAQVINHFGRLDAVVNSASIFEFDDVASFSFANLQKHLACNTAAGIVLAQALHTHVSARGETGGVVNLLDQKLWNPNPDFFSYTLSKAALEAANTLLAQALAPQLRVVGVAPGITLPSGNQTTEEFELAHQKTVLGKSSAAQDVAAAVVFALQCKSITGTTIVVDGGQHLAASSRDVMFLN